ncbi:acetate--CoA ligase family protein [Thermogemmatispora carboxidivorans]|uniref:acetate--CoA ligase family protein n=1 Tax=Thermogemmatispora carboxidivorans TaxID=1382306 RepID=UPI00069AC2EF|nr:acetate--CoA ligase family protein [Thermogemmatispora carboxidivorans]
MTQPSVGPQGSQTAPYSPQRLQRLFHPDSIAVIGASEKSSWSWNLHQVLHDGHFTGPIYYVNPRGGTIHGQPAYPRLSAIGAPVDLALIIVPPQAIGGVLQDMAETGVRNGVVITSGFAELGGEGERQQQELAAFARAHDIALLGPNCLGYINVAADIPAMPSPYPPVIKGHVALISQSGALTSALFSYAYVQHVGLSALVSTGNEAVISLSEVIDYYIEDEATKVIALFMESVRHPDYFRRVAEKALARAKPIVVLKIGRSEHSARIAQAHTGALVGDDRTYDALFRQLGIIRVDSIEELLITAETLTHTGTALGKRLAFVALSGGSCDLAADYTYQYGIELPDFSETTKEALRTLVPALGAVNNPLDTTGVVVNQPQLFEQILQHVGADPGIDLVVCAHPLPSEAQSEQGRAFSVQFLQYITAGLSSSRHPAFLLDFVSSDISEPAREAADRYGWPLLPGGIQRGLQALAKAMWWAEHQRRFQEQQERGGSQAESLISAPARLTGLPRGSWSEWQVRQLLAEYGIPVVPAQLVHSSDEAVAAAQQLGLPVALKIVSPEILHKSELGGVRLNLSSEQEVAAHFEDLISTIRGARPQARIEGVLVSPMRRDGLELLVGIVHDSLWGNVLAVGLGGLWVEVLRDTSLRVLPVSREDIRQMLAELQGQALLMGARGTTPADLEQLVEVIYRLSQLAQALGPSLEALEINPLRVHGPEIEVLDALLSWRE